MRKFLLSLAALFVGATAFADSVEFDLSTYDIVSNKITATKDGITVEFSDNNSMELKGTAGNGYIQAFGDKTLLKVTVEEGKTISSIAVDGAHGTAQADQNFVMTTVPTVECTPTVVGSVATYAGLACTSVQWYTEATTSDYVEISKVTVTLAAEEEPAASPVVLTFKDYQSTSGDSSGKMTTTSLIDSLQNAAGFVTCTAVTECYGGRIGYGCKMGSSSKTGTFTLQLVNPAAMDSIVVNCASYSATEGSLSINGGAAIDLTDGGASNKVLRNVTIVPTDVVETLTIATTAKRAYVKSITFYPNASATVKAPAFSVAAGSYYDAQSVEITCATEGAEVYYTLCDTVAATKYTEALNIAETTTVKAFAVLGTDTSAVATAEYVIAKKYANLAALVAAGEPTTTGEKVIVTLNNEVIDSIYVTSKGFRNGIYLTAGDRMVEIFCYDVPETWEVGGSVSGTVKGVWKKYNSTWEVCPETWEGITYTAKPLFENGDYLIVNKSAQAYLGGGRDWGTHATLIGKPQWFTATVSNGAYTLDSHQSNGGTKHFLGTGLYCDADAAEWTIAEAEGGLTIENGGNYLASAGKHEAIITKTAVDSTALWQLISKAQFIASLEAATKANPVDATALIYDPELKRNGNTEKYWTITGADGTGNPSNFAQGQNGNVASCGESYHSSNGFKAVQTIHLPYAGVYKLSAQAFYRQDNGAEEIPYLFAGDKKSNFPLLTGSENNMVSAYASFLEKKYTVEPIAISVLEAQDIQIGIAGSCTSTWSIFGEFELIFCGEDIDAAAAETIADYNELLEKKMNDSIKTAMTQKYEAYVANSTRETLSDLSSAVAAAKTSVQQYAATKTALDACDAKAAALTETGKAKYAELVAGINAAYEAGTMNADKSADVNAAYKTAVMAQTEVGAEFIDAAPANVKDNWTGATGMLVPNWANATPYTFAEHYQGSEIAAGVVLSQTIEGLPVGNYEVTLALAASYTSGRGFEAATGDGIAAGFANDSIKGIPVVERTGLAADGANVVTVTTSTTDGKIVYGLKNIANGGNWYAATVTSIKYVGVPAVEFPTMTIAFDSLTNVLTFTPSDTTFYYVYTAATKSVMEEEEIDPQTYFPNMFEEVTAEYWEYLIEGEDAALVKGAKSVDLSAYVSRGFTGEWAAWSHFVTPNIELSEATVYEFTVPEPEPELVSTDLTTGMYHRWTAAKDGEISTQQAWCDYVLNESTSMPYGNGNVDELEYVDLSQCYKLEITATEGAPRAMFNRFVANGTVNNEFPRDGYDATITNQDGSTTYVVKIGAIVEAQGCAHLHAIKGANWAPTTVTSIKIYATSEDKFPEDTASAISEISTDEEDAIFDLQGRKVSEKKAGQIYLIGGEKHLQK